MRQRAWTVGEEQALAVLADLGAAEIAEALERSRTGIRKKASRLGISVKKTSRITVTKLSQETIDRIKRNDPGLLCPACGERLAGVSKTGLCGVCHKAVLIEAHQERIAEIEAQRELWKWQQRSSRAGRALKKTQQRHRQEES